MALLKKHEVIQSEVSGQRYKVTGQLGSGGFGEAYRAQRLDEMDRDDGAESCLKITTNARSWHGEAFFADLLRDDSHAVQMFDAFPILHGSGRAARIRFCIEMELVAGGTVEDGCYGGILGWPEKRVQRQIRLLLGPLATLHRLGTSHRDITPRNVFMGERNVLKLGDFGIAKPGLKKSGVYADAWAPDFTPPYLGTWWSPADDIYQVGLLALTLLKGELMTNATKKPDVNPLARKGGPLRDAIKKAISVKSQRFANASEMMRALR
ncbi:MAG: serine/threonine protein kinase [Streptosporangiales bacterium]